MGDGGGWDVWVRFDGCNSRIRWRREEVEVQVELWVPSSPARRTTGWACVYLSPDPQLPPLVDAKGE
jgi:hypothetical protein